MSLGIQFLTKEKIKQQKQNHCPICRIPAIFSDEFQCVHCGTIHYVYECPKCGDKIIIPEYLPIIKLETVK